MNRSNFWLISALMVVSPSFAETAQSGTPASDTNEWVEETPAKAKIEHVQLGKFGTAKIKIEDFGGEPVGSGMEISVQLNCGKKRYQLVEPTLRVCEFKLARYDVSTNRLILTFKTTEMVRGRHACVKDDSYDFSLTTHCRK